MMKWFFIGVMLFCFIFPTQAQEASSSTSNVNLQELNGLLTVAALMVAIGALGGITRILIWGVPSNPYLPQTGQQDTISTKRLKLVWHWSNPVLAGMAAAIAFWLFNEAFGTLIGQILLAFLSGIAGPYILNKLVRDILGADVVAALAAAVKDDTAKVREQVQALKAQEVPVNDD